MRRPFKVSIAPVVPVPVPVPAPAGAPPDEPEVLSLQERFRRRMRAEDEALELANRDVLEYADAAKLTPIDELVRLFATVEDDHVARLSRILLTEAASLNSLATVKKVLGNAVGSSLEIDRNRTTSNLISKVHALRFLEHYAGLAELSESTQRELIRQYIAREWGPKLAEPTNLQVGSDKPTANLGRRRKTPEQRQETGREAPAPGVGTSRGAGLGGGRVSTAGPTRNIWTGQ